MVLAVAWAAGQHWDVPALSIPAMERTHGVPNALAFVVGALLAWWSTDRHADAAPVADHEHDRPATDEIGSDRNPGFSRRASARVA